VSRSGAVKVLSGRRKCRKPSRVIPINQRGPAGPRGATGSTAAPGPPAGSASGYSAGSGLTLSGSTFGADLSKLQARIGGSGCASDQALQRVAQDGTPTCAGLHAYSAPAPSGNSDAATAVPPGTWLLLGQVTAGGAAGDFTLFCQIDVAGSQVAQQSQRVVAGMFGTSGSVFLMATATTTAPAGTPVATHCFTEGSLPLNYSDGLVTAIPVAAVN
jgi:hypothetical protein